MQISLSGYQNSLFMLDVQCKAARAASCATAAGASPQAGSAPVSKPGSQLSSLTMLAAAHNFSELSVQDQTVTAVYRRDGSLAMQAASSFNLNVRSQEVALDLVISADALDVALPADLFKNGPVQFSLDYQFQTADIAHQIQARTVRPTRKVEDILLDLTKALSKVLSRKGDKNVQVLFDDEAVKVLFSDPETSKLMKELAGLLSMVNTMVLEGGKRDRYTIEISGKGNPYLDVQEQTQVDAETMQLRLNMVILPPAEAAQAVDAAEQPVAAGER